MVTESEVLRFESLTSTSSEWDEGRFFPTKSARIGSSRWPRSMSTASWMSVGLPKSIRASMAARIVRPVKSTSSTRTTFLPSSEKGMSVLPIWRALPDFMMSSRYSVMSSLPTGTGTPSIWEIFFPSLSASRTPPFWIPTRTRFSTPLFFSRIW